MAYFMEFIGNISSYSAAFLLGLFFVLDPCALLSNIAAIGYISKDYRNRSQLLRNYTMFIVGRVVTLTLLGLIFVFLFKESVILLGLQSFFGRYSEIIVAVLFMLIGVLLTVSDKISFLKINFSTAHIEKNNLRLSVQSLLMGSLLSLVLCPTNIVLFFAMLIPLAVGSTSGLVLPLIFAVSSALPIVVIMGIMVFSINSIDRFFKLTDTIGKYIVKISGIIFLLVGIYLFLSHLFFHNH